MGLRFRKSLKILPGVRLNFSKSGVSTSVGGPGATVNFGPKGTRHTVGIPGSGISYSAFKPKGRRGQNLVPANPTPDQQSGAGSGCGFALVLVFLILLIAKCASNPPGRVDPSPIGSSEALYPLPTGAAANYSDGETVTVTSSSLRVRSDPSDIGAVTGSLHRGESATIVRRSGEWLQVAQGAGLAWIAANHVKRARSQPQGLISSSEGHSARKFKKRKGGRSSGGSYFDAGCPCSGSRVCIGPRGGRYCITSGGRKRYGV